MAASCSVLRFLCLPTEAEPAWRRSPHFPPPNLRSCEACTAAVVRLLGGAAAAATASAVTTASAAATATTKLVAADDRMPEVGCQTAASATIGATATGPGTHAPAMTMAAVTVARRGLPWAGARSRVRRATSTPRLSSTSRAVKQWACATRVHGATSHREGMPMPGSDATVRSLIDGMTRTRATTASLSVDMKSPRAITTSFSEGMTSPRAAARNPCIKGRMGNATALSMSPAA